MALSIRDFVLATTARGRELTKPIYTPEAAMALQPVEEPLLPAHELYGVIPRDTRHPYDVREVIGRTPIQPAPPEEPAPRAQPVVVKPMRALPVVSTPRSPPRR